MSVAILPYDLGLLHRRRVKAGITSVAVAFGCSVTFHDDGGWLNAVGAARITGENATVAAEQIRRMFAVGCGPAQDAKP